MRSELSNLPIKDEKRRSGELSASLAAIELGAVELPVYWQSVALLIGEQRFDEAIRICEIGLSLQPSDFVLLQIRALTLSSLGCHEKAVEGVVRACGSDPRNPAIWNLLGGLLRDAGQIREAEECGRQACALNSNFAEGHLNLAGTLLLSGKYHEGFKEYEWRHKIKGAVSMKQPQWDGAELNGKRILLWAEQGAGDAIQFARYVKLVRKKGGQVTLGVSSLLTRLLSWMPGEISVVSSVVNPNEAFETQCALMSLPMAFGEDGDSIPPPVSFEIPDDRKREWRRRLTCQQRLKIGLVWTGSPNHSNDSHRSMQRADVERLLHLPDCRFFSLQVGPSSDHKESDRIENLAAWLTDFGETAAAISQMDLVITVDTSVAHLAGSLGVPTWVLLAFAPDWRWLLGRDDSPWYPSVRLFRQSKQNDWKGVVDAVAAQIEVVGGAGRNRTAE